MWSRWLSPPALLVLLLLLPAAVLARDSSSPRRLAQKLPTTLPAPKVISIEDLLASTDPKGGPKAVVIMTNPNDSSSQRPTVVVRALVCWMMQASYDVGLRVSFMIRSCRSQCSTCKWRSAGMQA